MDRSGEFGAAPVIAGRYVVERVLGEGGMGTVYRVRDDTSGASLALKRLHAGRTTPEEELFAREYRTLASLRHPRIVRVYEYGVDTQGPFYTMELLEGSDLAKRAPMPWREACACLRDVASTLGVLHARRLVHRDLSPRNLWHTPDGRLKLLDFGALARFGVAREVVGTAPFVAPEALAGKSLDQRTDLFALGALGYWLLTGTHAFRAAHVGELVSAWQAPPLSVSAAAELVVDARDIPAELDRLIHALLRLDASARPHGTADVVDQLTAIAGLVPEPEDLAVQGYLESVAFVGRERERARFAHSLADAEAGRVHALVVEGPEGAGLTRLLGEFAMVARLDGAAVAAARATNSAAPYELANSLACALCRAQPEHARAAALEHGEELADLSPELAGLLQRPYTPHAANGSAAQRLRMQAALRAFVLSMAHAHTLVLLIDDLQDVDEPSQALLASLVRADVGHRLLIVAALRADERATGGAHARNFGWRARHMRLGPLALPELRDMLRSMFGEVPYLERLTARLHQLSVGSPGHVSLLVRQLVQTAAIRYVDGAWSLPSDLPEGLPTSFRGSVLAALASLPTAARELARHASLVEHGALGSALLADLANEPPEVISESLACLLELGLFRAEPDGYALSQPALRATLRAELASDARIRAELRLAHHYAGHHALVARVQAALLFLRAGEPGRANHTLLETSRRILAGEHGQLRTLVPMYVEALALVRAGGGSEDAQIPLLGVLAVGGYQVDRTYAVRFGDQAIRALEQRLRFGLAVRLRPFLGGLLALLCALCVSGLERRLRRSRIGVLEAVTWLVSVTGYLMGPAAMCIDVEKLRTYARVFEPLRALGKNHSVALVHGFCEALVASLEERCAAAQDKLRPLIDRLASSERIRGLPAQNRQNLLGAAAYTYGIRQALSCDSRVSETADMLSGMSPMHAMQAEHLRALYAIHRGEMARAHAFEQRVELKAIQLGTAWQAELLAPSHTLRLALWTNDAAASAGAARALARLATEQPTFGLAARRARAAALALRGRLVDARDALIAEREEPLARLGWVSMRGLLARVHNQLGEHAEARVVCLDALGRIAQGDRAFVIMYLAVELELAVAEAGLGDRAAAERRITMLRAAHGDKGLLVESHLERAFVRVALLARDREAALARLAALDACHRRTEIPSLLAYGAELRAELTPLRLGALDQAPENYADASALVSRLSESLGERAGREELAASLLSLLATLSGAEHGFVLWPDAEGPDALLGEPPPSDVVAWAEERLDAACAYEGSTEALDDQALQADPNVLRAGTTHHRAVILPRVDGQTESAVAAVVLASEYGQVELPASALLYALGEQVAHIRAQAASVRPRRTSA